MLFGGNPRYENMPLIGRGSPPPTVTWAPAGVGGSVRGPGVCRGKCPCLPSVGRGVSSAPSGGLEGAIQLANWEH